MDELQIQYPWTKAPLVASGPMRLIALASLPCEVSNAGGLGFVGGGSDAGTLESMLEEVKALQAKSPNLKEMKDVLPVGVGFLVWAGEKLLNDALPVIEKYRPAAIWLYAANNTQELIRWTQESRRVTNNTTKIWIQIGSVQEAIEYTKACQPDVLVVQGQDAGGHGLTKCAGIIALFPEVDDAISTVCEKGNIKKPIMIAAGGIMDGRGAAAALTLGASGICMGTRYLGSYEANIAKGYGTAVIQASDGGQTTARTHLYDILRGTRNWPKRYGGRGVLNESYFDAEKGMSIEENQRLHDQALQQGDKGWTENARLTTYAGTGVGLVKDIKGAGEITEEVREGAKRVLKASSGKLSPST